MQPPAEGLASRLFLVPALRTQPDRRLVALVREGYETAFEEIVRRYGKPLSHYAASIVGSRSDDVLQDAFSKALLGEAEVEDSSGPGGSGGDLDFEAVEPTEGSSGSGSGSSGSGSDSGGSGSGSSGSDD
jgi:hypothetical protein